MKISKSLLGILVFALLMINIVTVHCWSNKGTGDNEEFGTHKWISSHALESVLQSVEGTVDESRFDWLVENLDAYLLGTKAPDKPFSVVSGANFLDYFDFFNHHNYYNSLDDMIEDRASVRAQEEYSKAVEALFNDEYTLAAFFLGAMTHYLADLSNYQHAMGSDSLLGSEPRSEHSDYEDQIRKLTDDMDTKYFNITYRPVNMVNFTNGPYEYARHIGWFSHQQAAWMNENYQSGFTGSKANTEFELKTEAVLNYTINMIADLIYTLGFYELSPYQTASTEWNYRSLWTYIIGGMVGLVLLVMVTRKAVRKIRNKR